MIQAATTLDRSCRQQFKPDHHLSGADFACLGVLMLVSLAMFFWGLGSYGIIDPGDGYFAEGAREMLELGDYITPHLNYQIYFSKPILIYWLISSAYHVFGVNEFAARFWSAALSTCLVVATYWLGRCIFNRKTGLFAGAILAASPLVVTFAKLSMVDAVLMFFVGLAMTALLLTTIGQSKRWWPVFYVALGLSVLTKGPVGVVLLAASCIAFLVVRRPSLHLLREWAWRLNIIRGALIFGAIVAPWHVAVARATDGLFLQVFYLYENLARFQGHVNHEHRQVWYYLAVLAYGFFPWVLFLPAAIGHAMKTRHCNGKLGPGGADALLYLACFVSVVLGFFTLSVGKVQTYILPAFPAISLLVASLLDLWTTRTTAAPRWLSIAIAALAALAALSTMSAIVLALCLQGVPLWADLNALAAGILVTGGWFLAFLWFERGRKALSLYALVATAVVGCAMISQVAFEEGYRLRQARLAELIHDLRGKHAQVAFYQEFKPSVMFYLRRPVDTFFSPIELVHAASRGQSAGGESPPESQLYILAPKKALSSLLPVHRDRLKLVDRKGSWYLFVAEGLTLHKLPTLEELFRKKMPVTVNHYTWGALPFAGGHAPHS